MFGLRYHTSRNDLISARKDYQQRWQKYLAEFGDDDDMVVVVEGRDKAQMKAALDDAAQRIAAGDHFLFLASVEGGESYDRMPLMYFRRSYSSWSSDKVASAPPAHDDWPSYGDW